MVQVRGSRDFHQGGESPGQSDKKALTTIFFSPQLILQKSNGHFKKNLSFFKAPDGSNFFQGVQLFPGGVQLLIPFRNPFDL